MVYGFVLPAIYWSLFYAGKKFTPVKLADFKEDSVTFVFANEQYGKEFEQINQEPYPWKHKDTNLRPDAANL
jgi:uncharacterized protein (UPF0332 family)